MIIYVQNSNAYAPVIVLLGQKKKKEQFDPINCPSLSKAGVRFVRVLAGTEKTCFG